VPAPIATRYFLPGSSAIYSIALSSASAGSRALNAPSSRCLRCRSEAVARRRRLIKRQLVTEAGGHCHICGYDRYIGALQFHHLDPAAKTFSVGQAGLTRSLERARQEAQKCALLCSNCHAEVEGGLASLTAAGSIVA